MTKLTKIRIALTLGALAGIAPVTLIFLWGLLFLVIAIVYMDRLALPVTIIAISVPSLWGCWKAYAAAMASKPKHPRDWRVIASVILATVWAFPCSAAMNWDLTILFTFLMPGLTAAIMLGVTEYRARRVDQNGELMAIPD
ncbi:hypothetical protein PS631_00236 [Pseudomonas fluorescens]|uniref:Transmembrane protein n=1 Tax=Pseudomonas fluorescens TaxID=294 RepID=A0A5E6PAE2_PSEFL|nr:hypothetical protein [Pseudomonas fluorescens]RYZ22746.1 MAG: hypothetical protein EOO16_07775 [Chitinophagaceae bacterium]VVM40111.1 hypothetical protein PS631_00236 [Pseudomonas fluorescens]